MRDCLSQAGGRRGRRQISMALMPWATHVLQWPVQWVAKEQSGANPKNRPRFGLRAATRPHEDGITSNRASAMAR